MVCRRCNRCSFGTLIHSGSICFTRARTNYFHTKRWCRWPLGQVIHWFFPMIYLTRRDAQGIKFNAALDCGHRLQDRQWWLSCPLYHPRQALYVSRNPAVHGLPITFWNVFYTGHYKYPLDIKRIEEAMPDVVGTHDFSSFVASGSQTKDHVGRSMRLLSEDKRKQWSDLWILRQRLFV